jgi:hypothetical protein
MSSNPAFFLPFSLILVILVCSFRSGITGQFRLFMETLYYKGMENKKGSKGIYISYGSAQVITP